MKKVSLVIVVMLMAVGLVIVTNSVKAADISDEQKNAIVDRCDSIKDVLKTVQHNDSRTRVYLGRYYETILNKFITPLNVRLVENNLSNNDLIDNQNNFANARTNFIIDYIEYQKVLENLVAIDCKVEPVRFYEKLEEARFKRSVVSEDVNKLAELANDQVNLVVALRGKL